MLKEANVIDPLNQALNPNGFTVEFVGNALQVRGVVIDSWPPVRIDPAFQDIQTRILDMLDSAKLSIRVVMAWFNNEVLLQKLVKNQRQGIDV